MLTVKLPEEVQRALSQPLILQSNTHVLSNIAIEFGEVGKITEIQYPLLVVYDGILVMVVYIFI